MRLLLVLLLALLLAPPAQAATVGFETDGGAIDEETGEQSIESSASVFVSDLAGEVNDLTIRVKGSVVVVTDRAAQLKAGKPCAVAADGSARCRLPDADVLEVGVAAGAGDDVVRVVGSFGTYVDGGEGTDRVTGGAGEDVVLGGPGADVVRGGAGSDVLVGDEPFGASSAEVAPSPDTLDGGAGADRVSFEERRAGVRIDLAAGTAAEDHLAAVEGAQVGMGDDVLLGDAGGQSFTASGGRDTVDGRGGDDDIEGAEIVRGGAGDDVIDGSQARTVSCGTGVDELGKFPRLAPADCEWVHGTDNTVVVGRDLLRAGTGGLVLRVHAHGVRTRSLRLRAAGVLVGRATQPRGEPTTRLRVPVRLTPAGRRLLGSGRAAQVVVAAAEGGSRVLLPAH